MKHLSRCTFLALFIAFFAYLQLVYKYHFFYIEQSQLFLFDYSYLFDKLLTIGGISDTIGAFLLQFMILPYAGSLIVSVLLTSISILVFQIVKQVDHSNRCLLLSTLPSFFLLFIQFDFNYKLGGTVAYLIMLIGLFGYGRIKLFRNRFVTGLLLTILIYCALGPISLLFAFSAFLLDGVRREDRWYYSLFFVFLSVLLATLSLYWGAVGEYKWAFLPVFYYQKTLQPNHLIYYSWFFLPTIIGIASLFKMVSSFLNKRPISLLFYGIQLCLLMAYAFWGVDRHGHTNMRLVKELDYYARTRQWDKTIELCVGPITNYLYMCHLNMALLNKGELTDKMFRFDQRGVQGLLVNWNKTENVSCLLSDIHYYSGSIAVSQHFAFEGFVCGLDGANVRMLQRLVQTNLIFGEYKVAEKYLSKLDKTFAYKSWAAHYRTFLYNDEAVDRDVELGPRRRALPVNNRLALFNGLDSDLHMFIDQCPDFESTLHYLSGYYLLSKNLEGVKLLLDKYYLGKQMLTLPIHLQEAVLILSETEPEYAKLFALSDSICNHFLHYRKLFLENKNNPNLAGVMNRTFGQSYWFYYMFK
ncbi:MAG: DUF6057 family protein [Phocaeicola sp.]